MSSIEVPSRMRDSRANPLHSQRGDRSDILVPPRLRYLSEEIGTSKRREVGEVRITIQVEFLQRREITFSERREIFKGD